MPPLARVCTKGRDYKGLLTMVPDHLSVINTQNVAGLAPLHMSYAQNALKSNWSRLLMENGVDVNVVD